MPSPRFGPYALCGWKVVSEIELPELCAWDPKLPEQQPLLVDLGEVGYYGLSLDFATTHEEDAVLRIAEVAAFRVHAGGDRVTIQLEAGADPLDVRTYLYGSVLAILCYKRGLLPLHGASVLVNQGAIILSGPSGAGKSTLATAMALRGHALLCDDVCPIDATRSARPLLRPAFPRVKLLSDVISTLKLGPVVTYSMAEAGTKGHFGMAAFPSNAVITHPVPVLAIYALEPPSGDKAKRTLLPQKEAFQFLDSQAHRRWMARALGKQHQLFQQTTALVSAVPVYRLQRPGTLGRLDETVDILEAASHNRAKADGVGIAL